MSARRVRSIVVAACIAALPTAAARAASTADPFLWLEDVHGARAMAWVRAENAKTLGVLQSDPRYAGLYADAVRISENRDRIPTPEFIADDVYNFWQDAYHVRGVWRYTTPAEYAKSAPAWTTALDLDALAKNENANWVWHGAACDWPTERRCLISLSDGGEDADTVREFDRKAQRMDPGGFVLPAASNARHGKTRIRF